MESFFRDTKISFKFNAYSNDYSNLFLFEQCFSEGLAEFKGIAVSCDANGLDRSLSELRVVSVVQLVDANTFGGDFKIVKHVYKSL